MKPSPKQKEIILQVRNILSFWILSNDINSPTHLSDIDEIFNSMTFLSQIRPSGTITEEEVEPIKEKLKELFCDILRIK